MNTLNHWIQTIYFSAQKWQVTRKMFPFDDVIMKTSKMNIFSHLQSCFAARDKIPESPRSPPRTTSWNCCAWWAWSAFMVLICSKTSPGNYNIPHTPPSVTENNTFDSGFFEHCDMTWYRAALCRWNVILLLRLSVRLQSLSQYRYVLDHSQRKKSTLNANYSIWKPQCTFRKSSFTT